MTSSVLFVDAEDAETAGFLASSMTTRSRPY